MPIDGKYSGVQKVCEHIDNLYNLYTNLEESERLRNI